MESVRKDLLYGLRALFRNPGFSSVAILTLALGVGANTAIFSIVSHVLLRSLPYREAERLVTLWERSPLRGIDQEPVSPPTLADWRNQQNVFERLAFWTGPSEFNLVNSDGVEKVQATYASSDIFPTLDVRPVLGRTFLPEEDLKEGHRAALISYEFWQRRFAGDPNAVGQILTMDTFGRRDYTIVGVLPPGFRFPNQSEVWLAAGWNGLPLDRRAGHWLNVLARLKPGATITQAQAEMDTIQGRIAAQFQNAAPGTHVAIVPLLDQLLGARVRSALYTLWGIVACVLLIACANVANLQLARAAARGREIVLRLALGATRWRIARQLFTESLLLALAGGALGVMMAFWLLRLIVAFNAGTIARLQDVRLDNATLFFTLLISLATGLLFGFAPAWQASKPDLNEALKGGGGRGVTAGLHRSRLRGLLVIAQVALALMLLVGAGLMLRSFIRLARIDRGFQTSHLLTANLDFSVQGFTTWVQPTATRPQVTLQEVIRRLKALPGVQEVGAVSGLPRGTSATRGMNIAIENRPPLALDALLSANFQGITPDYFRAMGVPLLKGRAFTDADLLEAQPVAIINETMARRYFPNEDPVGKRLAMYGRNPGQLAQHTTFASSPWIEIVGVVGDIKRLTLEAATVPDIFMPYWQWPMQSPTLVVRTTADPANTAGAIRNEVRAVNKRLPLPSVREMSQLLSDIVAQPRFYTLLASLFGVIALILAGAGIYGVMAYSASQRTHEIGIRMALGAEVRDVLRLVIGEGMKLTLTGVAIGLLAALALTRLLKSLLFSLSPTDPLTFAAVVMLLILIALAACYIPARRAARTDPMVALRHD
jgi:putative ABC transport system permease protein